MKFTEPLQELFTTAVLATYRQGEQSMRGDVCAYCGPNGLKCAVGHLIDDEDYLPQMDEDYYNSVNNVLRMLRVPYNETLRSMLSSLQLCHDKWGPHRGKTFREFFWERAANVAEDFGLEMPEKPEV